MEVWGGKKNCVINVCWWVTKFINTFPPLLLTWTIKTLLSYRHPHPLKTYKICSYRHCYQADDSDVGCIGVGVDIGDGKGIVQVVVAFIVFVNCIVAVYISDKKYVILKYTKALHNLMWLLVLFILFILLLLWVIIIQISLLRWHIIWTQSSFSY